MDGAVFRWEYCQQAYIRRNEALCHEPYMSIRIIAKNLLRATGKKQSTLLLTSLLACGLTHPAFGQVLEHRYDFNQLPGTLIVPDLAGSAPGTVNGLGNFDGNKLQLSADFGEYVDFGPDLITGYNSITIEGWVSFENTGQYTRFFDFGDTLADGSGPVGMNFSAWSVNGAARFEVFDTNQQSYAVATLPALNNQGMVHIATVYDPQAPLMALYVNGVLKASRTDVTIPRIEPKVLLPGDGGWSG